MNSIDEILMNESIKESKKCLDIGEVPVGAIIAIDNRIIARANNLSISKNDPTAHAEILALRRAAKSIGNYRITGASLYVTLEPCAMCYGAIVHARISRLVFGAYDPKTGACGSSIKLHEQSCFNHVPQISGGVLERECSFILKEFFKDKRN